MVNGTQESIFQNLDDKRMISLFLSDFRIMKDVSELENKFLLGQEMWRNINTENSEEEKLDFTYQTIDVGPITPYACQAYFVAEGSL